MTPLRLAVLFSLCVALVISVWRPSDTGGVAAGIEGRLLDLRFALRGTREPPPDIAILAIDDAALASLDAFPLPRSALAAGIEAARAQGARGIALDLLLPGKAAGDDALAATLAGRADTVLAVSFTEAATTPNPALVTAIETAAIGVVMNPPMPLMPGLLGPEAAFLTRATLGHVNIAPEPDGSLRRMPMALAAPGGTVVPALPLALARLVTGEGDHAGLGRSGAA